MSEQFPHESRMGPHASNTGAPAPARRKILAEQIIHIPDNVLQEMGPQYVQAKYDYIAKLEATVASRPRVSRFASMRPKGDHPIAGRIVAWGLAGLIVAGYWDDLYDASAAYKREEVDLVGAAMSMLPGVLLPSVDEATIPNVESVSSDESSINPGVNNG